MARKEPDFGGLFEGVPLSEPLNTFKDNVLTLRGILSIAYMAVEERREKTKQAVSLAEKLRNLVSDDLPLKWKQYIDVASEKAKPEDIRRFTKDIQGLSDKVSYIHDKILELPETVGRELQLLRPICFVYLVTIWDAFILDTARMILRVHPQYLLSASTFDSEINKASLWNANTIEEVRSLMIDDQVRKLDSGRGKLAQVFEDYWGIEWGKSGVSLDSVKEIRARRDIWVHNKGLINQQYLNMVKENPSKLGQVAEITYEYLTRSIAILTKLAIYIHKVACEKHYAGTDCS